MKRGLVICVLALFFPFSTHVAVAHFGMIIPSDSMITQGNKRDITITLSFSHPFERVGMVMEKPMVFAVMTEGKRANLLDSLKQTRVMGQPAWETTYRVRKPGTYTFFVEPRPYWELAEDSFIVHYAKTVITAFGDDEGWDAELGLKTEIVPLARPFGLYAGNVFQGIVKLEGKPVPYAEVEVEYYNQEGKAQAPTEYMSTQIIKADKNGVFTYGVPKAGWWGFAGLNTAKEKIKHNGEEKEVELGAVIWVRFHDWHEK